MPVSIDPPEGWRFGFPKPAPIGVDRASFLASLPDWLVENGYPRELINSNDAVEARRVLGTFADEKAEAPDDRASDG